MRWRRGEWWALCSLAGPTGPDPSLPPSPLATTTLQCLHHFSADLELCYRVLKQALLLPLLLLTIPPESHIQSEGDTSSIVDPKAPPSLRLLAAQVLRMLAVTLDQAPESDPSPRLQFEKGILGNILPLAMLQGLKNPDAGALKFLTMASSNLSQPTAIWSEEVRGELRRKVRERIAEHNTAMATGEAASDDELTWLEEFR